MITPGTFISGVMRTLLLPVAALLLSACAVEPPRYGEIITMRAGEAPREANPSAGTVWRLDENELKRLSPAPIVPAPPPPNYPPPPRPNDPPPPYYSYPLPYWGGFYYWH